MKTKQPALFLYWDLAGRVEWAANPEHFRVIVGNASVRPIRVSSNGHEAPVGYVKTGNLACDRATLI